MIKNKEGFLQISFQWLFAIIVGIFILFLAIYGITKLIGTEETIQSAKTSKEIGILLNPLETGFESGKSSYLTFPLDTRIYNICEDFGEFGKQKIRVSQKSLNKWTRTDIEVGFENKYIFSKDPAEGRKMYLFSKPFRFPFKVTDLIYLIPSTDIYCFIDAPEDIEDEIKTIGKDNLLTDNCSDSKGIINVCFSETKNCDIIVDYKAKYVEKSEGKVYFEDDSLMYAGIFSDKTIYECQLKRIMKRLVNLAELYRDKADFIAIRGCSSNLNADLQQLIGMAQGLDNSNQLNSMTSIVDELDRKNQANSLCKLW